jgi:hypothetical protein
VTYSLPSGSLEKSTWREARHGPPHGLPHRFVVRAVTPVHLCPDTECRRTSNRPERGRRGAGGQLAEQYDPSQEIPESEATTPTRRSAQTRRTEPHGRRRARRAPTAVTADPGRRARRKGHPCAASSPSPPSAV